MYSGDLRIRPVREADLPIFFQHQQDPEAAFMAAFTAEDPANLEAFLTHWHRLLQSNTVMKRSILSAGEVVGHIASWMEDDRTEVTYWIARDHWGRGVATAALSLFLRGIDTRPIYARVAEDNAGSIRVLEKCGFVVVDKDRGFANARGELIDELLLRLDATERSR